MLLAERFFQVLPTTVPIVDRHVSRAIRAFSRVRRGAVNSATAVGGRRITLFLAMAGLTLFLAVPAMRGRDKTTYGEGFTVDFQFPEAEVLQSVQEVVTNGIIRGSKEYNKDEYVDGAEASSSSPLFPKWSGPGKVFYKVRKQALDPRNFKESNDVGTLAVRYVVASRGPGITNLRIDAVFVEDFQHRTHPSNGSVELAEFQDIKDRIDKVEQAKKQAVENERKRQQQLAAEEAVRKRQADAQRAIMSESSPELLEQRVRDLRRQLERLVKAPGATLKSAPFSSATSLKTLAPGSEVMILVSTQYWYGVETEGGQHGWIHRAQLEQLP
jgi:hypothetical protein